MSRWGAVRRSIKVAAVTIILLVVSLLTMMTIMAHRHGRHGRHGRQRAFNFDMLTELVDLAGGLHARVIFLHARGRTRPHVPARKHAREAAFSSE